MAPTKKNTAPTSTKKKVAPPETPGTQAAMQSIRNYLIISIVVTALVVLVGGYFIYTLAQANVTRVRAQEYQVKLSEANWQNLNLQNQSCKLEASRWGYHQSLILLRSAHYPSSEDFEEF
jgi:hypothetical protein